MAIDLESKFEKLIRGQVKYKSDSLSFNLLISRLQKKYGANQTAEELKSCLKEMNAFCEKYSAVVAKELEGLKKL